MSRASLRLLPFALAPLATACSGIAYRPAAPPPLVEADGVKARVTRLVQHDAIIGGVRVEVTVDDAPEGARVDDALLVLATREPCSFGYMPDQIALDGDSGNIRERPLRNGATLDFEYSGTTWYQITHDSYRLDVRFVSNGVHRCVPLVLTSPAPERAWAREQYGVAALSAEFLGQTRAVQGSVSTVGAAIYGGAWAGPVRLLAGTGLLADICSEGTCALVDGKPSSMIDLPLLLRADAFPITWSHVALGVGARYALMGTFLDRTVGGHTAAAYHSLALTPKVALTAANRPANGIETGVKAFSIDFEIPVGLSTPLADYAHPALTLGFGLLMTEGF